MSQIQRRARACLDGLGAGDGHHVRDPPTTLRPAEQPRGAHLGRLRPVLFGGPPQRLAIDELGVEFTPRIATPCLAGILTDTGNFRYGNTNREVLETAGYLIDKGVAYVDLTDRLQWRHPTYFRTLGKVMDTVHFELDGELVIAHFTAAMRTGAGAADDDSDDFVGIIRYGGREDRGHPQGTRARAWARA